MRRLHRFLLLASLGILAAPSHVLIGQQTREVGREAALALEFDDLNFDLPRAERHELDSGVTVFHLHDPTLPLVTLYARFRGGYSLLPRDLYAAGMALPALLRAGGTKNLPPDSLDFLLDFHALQLSFAAGGTGASSSLNALTRHLEPGVRIWGEILKNPRFDSLEVEIWRDRQLEGVRRRRDDPGRLAVSEFNRLMYGDHPIGWELTQDDLGPDRFSTQALEEVHGRILCPENLILGVVGDVGWGEIRPILDSLLADWPACTGPLLDHPDPDIRRQGGIFLLPRELDQTTVIMAQPGGISQSTDADYFASRVGNSILGASGFSSRLVTRVRTEAGYAYSASSLWTTPSRYEGIVGAMTRTRGESTIAAIRLILDTFREMREEAPEQEEVDRVIDRSVNGFVFNFQEPSQIVARQMDYLALGLPEDWLEQYVEGIQGVSPEDVRRVFQRYVAMEDMVILVVGDPESFDGPLEALGEVKIWDVEDPRRGRLSADAHVQGGDPPAHVTPLGVPEAGLTHHLR